MAIETGDLVQIENQSDGTWAGPYEVLDTGYRNDFIAGGTVPVFYLLPPVTHPDPNFVDYPVKLSLWAVKATRRSDGLLAFTFPIVWCRLFQPDKNGSSA